MKIQEIQAGQDKKEITGILQQAAPAGVTTFQDGKQVPSQDIVIDGIAGTFWCGQKPLDPQDCNKPITLLCKASVYQNQMQYKFSRPQTGGGRFGGKSQQEINETRRSIAFSYCVDKEKLGLAWGPEVFFKANIVEKWIKDGVMPVTFSQQTTTTPATGANPNYNPEGQVPEGDDIPF